MRKPQVHLTGIGGIAVSALARWFLAQNWAVSGSDIAESQLTKELAKEGVKLKIGHKSGNLPQKLDLLVFSQAIPRGNPEIREAYRRRVRVLSYPQCIGELTRRYTTVSISGAHGKSTTTALVALVLMKAGLDPTVIIGTKLKELHGSNFRAGKSPYLVLEADEYGRAFLNYSPAVAVITNIDREHLDTYKDLRDIKKTFLDFIALIAPGGSLVVNKDNVPLRSLAHSMATVAKKHSLKVVWYTMRGKERLLVQKNIKALGVHNVSNGVAALHAARLLGVPDRTALKAIGRYRGAWRRLEYRGRCRASGVGCRVFDDYAHHPTEIKATLAALRERYPARKIICVFQPHQAERLARLFGEFQKAFAGADETLILPVYQVAGRDRVERGLSAEHPKFNSRELVRAIQKKEPHTHVFYLENPKNLRNAVAVLVGPTACGPLPSPSLKPKSYKREAVLVMMGAGDIVNYTGLLIRRRH